MNEKELEKLINKDKYQVFVLMRILIVFKYYGDIMGECQKTSLK